MDEAQEALSSHELHTATYCDILRHTATCFVTILSLFYTPCTFTIFYIYDMVVDLKVHGEIVH